MQLRPAGLSLLLVFSLAGQAPQPAARRVATDASAPSTKLPPGFRAEGLALLDQSLRNLQKAHAKDPLASQVAVQKVRVENRLQRLRDLFAQLPQRETPLDSLPTGGQGAGRELRDAIAQENKAWQLDRLSQRLFITGPDAIDLAVQDSPTIRTILVLQPQVFNQITGPLASAQLAELEASIGDLARQWRSFFTNVTLQQFPWESTLNGALDRKRAIQDIPGWEWRVVHSVAGLVTYQSRTSSTGPSVAGAELIGIQCFDRKQDFKPTWGLSALWTLRTQEEASHGYGLLGTYREFKLGFKHAKALNGRANNQAIVSINLARFLNLRGNAGLDAAIARAEAYAKTP